MTMLAPGGDGHRRRSGWGGTLLIVLAGVVLFAAGFGVGWMLRGGSSGTAAAPTEESPTPQPCVTVTVVPGTGLPKPGQVTTNVYNATDRNGLAAETAAELASRGFVVDVVANDPLSKTITGVAEIRYGPKGADAAKLMRFYIPGATLVKDQRTTAAIDTVLGEKFRRVAPSDQVQKALTTPVPSPSGPGCSPTPGTGSPQPAATPDGSPAGSPAASPSA